MRRSVEPDELLRSLMSDAEDGDYEREVISTMTGRASAELRRRAVALAARGHDEEAHALLLEAARLHPQEDVSAAAASARHDLGHSFSCRPRGVRLENLLAAERCFRAALACPPRAARPRRAAQTQSSLSLCLRDLAGAHDDPTLRGQCLAEAAALLRMASASAEALGPTGWTLAAGFLVNLGNLLVRDPAEVDAALTAYRRALDVHRKAQEHGIHNGARRERDLARLAAARGYLARGRKGDAGRAVDLAMEVVRAGDERTIDLAHLVATEAWMESSHRARTSHALKHLQAINLAPLPPDKIPIVADMFARLGERDRALELLEWLIDHWIRERGATKADHAADEAALRAHHAAAAAARLYAAKGEAAAAFLVLENCSGLRFIEMTSTLTWQPADPVARELLRELRRRQATATMFDQVASMLERLPKEHWRDALEQASAKASEAAPASPDLNDALRRLQEYASDDDPVARLRREVDAVVQDAERHTAVLRRHEPATSAALDAVGHIMDRRGLDALLNELPGHVLVRISLAKDLLVVAVWREAGKLISKAHRVPFPRDAWKKLQGGLGKPPSAASREIGAMLERLDLSPSLPPGRGERVVVLPSSGAAFLPLGALGPPGKRLLDRFDAILWLPSLFPIRTRQDAHPPRERALLVTPPGTHLREVAIGDVGSREDWLNGNLATRDRVLERVGTADVVCFYTHGRHDRSDGPSIKVADGDIGLADLASCWAGVERVELWACETGVSLPVDPMTPLGVDEPFGLDFELLRAGVRSAIGTLWPVNMIMTAAIVRHYRRGVAAGVDAARALAEAQRWWLADGVPSFMRLLADRPEGLAISDFVTSLGGSATGEEVMTVLGPAGSPSAPMDAATLQRWREHLTCPVSWGGFRFVGVPDRRPLVSWTDEHARPADDHVRHEVGRQLEEHAAPREDFTEWQERELDELARTTTGAPTPEQAIKAARRFRDRIASSHAHNLFAGLAWLHEALASDALIVEDRHALALEAAHLWLDLAGGEAMHPVLSGPAVSARTRARALLVGLADGPDLAVARARLEYLDAVTSGAELAGAAARAWQVLGSDLGPPSLTYDAIRRATVACEWFVVAPSSIAGVAEHVVAHMDAQLSLLSGHRAEPDDVGVVARLVEARNALAVRLNLQLGLSDLHYALTPRELVRATRRQVRRLGELGLPATQASLDQISASLGQIEGAIWGWPSDRRPLISSSGTPGRAYRDLMGDYLAGKAKVTDDAAHMIACLQYACDLRPVLHHNTMRMAAARADLQDVLDRGFAGPLRHRDALWTALADAAELGEIEDSTGPGLDPFNRSARALLNEGRSALDTTSWILGELCSWQARDERETQTAAYQAVRMASYRTDLANDTWDKIVAAENEFARTQGTEVPSITERFDPGIVLETNESLLRRLPEGRGVLSLVLDDRRGLVGACLWRDRRGRGQRLVHVEDSALTGLLADLLRLREADHTPRQGQCSERREAWTRLDRWLAPHLRALWSDGLANRLHWSVLAPGALRSLPLIGLHAGTKLIASHVASLVHLPSLGFSLSSRSVTPAVGSACLLARARTEGDTSFGEAAIETLRRAYPTCAVIDPQTLRGRTIVEVEALEALCEGLGSLRMYGVGASESINTTTSSLRLEGQRALDVHNLANLRLGACDSVELWACVSGGSEVRSLIRGDHDRLPGLVSGFLAAGARGVIDLAWPIPDLVKAIVCELFGIARTRTPWGPSALATAVATADTMITNWARRERGNTSVVKSLASLDATRRATAANHGIDPSCVVPFAACAGAPSLEDLTVATLFDETTHPSHLAAFRWWGAAEP